ncbi:MAG TPA: sulfite exporter TauE/SafE family protein [Synergistales bacterium]|nr:sulfite exporter TauE/SafE family protein [Synergistales bacterium]
MGHLVSLFAPYGLGPLSFSLFIISAFLSGFSKTALPGGIVLVVPIMASIFPAKISVGLTLPILMMADLFSARHYRKNARIKHLSFLLPSALVGVWAGYILMDSIDSVTLRPLIGIIVLSMLGIYFLVRFFKEPDTLKRSSGEISFSLSLTLIFGFIAGVTTTLANAAAPVMSLYLIVSGMSKKDFIGTAAWFFFIINWVKVPFYLKLGLITGRSFLVDLTMLPVIILGAFLGIYMVRWISQGMFNRLILVAAFISSINLIL